MCECDTQTCKERNKKKNGRPILSLGVVIPITSSVQYLYSVGNQLGRRAGVAGGRGRGGGGGLSPYWVKRVMASSGSIFLHWICLWLWLVSTIWRNAVKPLSKEALNPFGLTEGGVHKKTCLHPRSL